MLIGAQCTAGLPAGTVRRRDVWSATSSPGNPAWATMTGATVRAMLRVGLSDAFADRMPRTFRGRPAGRLQMVGITAAGDRIEVGGEALDDARTYRVTASDLELAVYGGLLADEPADVRHDSSVILPEVLEDYLRTADGAGAPSASESLA